MAHSHMFVHTYAQKHPLASFRLGTVTLPFTAENCETVRKRIRF